ncbi:hypothetical protein TNCV_4171631 [Trichonephila clavipes]|nr:hypothetical protein TNCV_4171631 [Trichonephila clavipes]
MLTLLQSVKLLMLRYMVTSLALRLDGDNTATDDVVAIFIFVSKYECTPPLHPALPVQTAVTDHLKAIPIFEFHQCYEEWKKRLQRCGASDGSYFERDNVEL